MDGTAVWDPATGTPLLMLGAGGSAGSPDPPSTGRLLFRRFRALDEFAAHSDGVWSVAFSPDGGRLITAGGMGGGMGGGTATIWDALSGRELLVLHGHAATIVQAIFSPDGSEVATASRDGTAKLWDASTGQERLTLYGDGVGLEGLAFSPDGTRLAVGSDKSIRVYLLRMQDLLALARTRLTRAWTWTSARAFSTSTVVPTSAGSTYRRNAQTDTRRVL